MDHTKMRLNVACANLAKAMAIPGAAQRRQQYLDNIYNAWSNASLPKRYYRM